MYEINPNFHTDFMELEERNKGEYNENYSVIIVPKDLVKNIPNENIQEFVDLANEHNIGQNRPVKLVRNDKDEVVGHYESVSFDKDGNIQANLVVTDKLIKEALQRSSISNLSFGCIQFSSGHSQLYKDGKFTDTVTTINTIEDFEITFKEEETK